jgi:hypothetical protein
MKTSSGPASARQHLNSLAIATILAVGLLAVAWPAEAKIVYTPTNITIGRNSSYNLDVNNDGISDFTFTLDAVPFICDPPGFCGWFIFTLVETPASGNGAEGSPPARLTFGDQIGPSQTFYEGTGTMASLWGQDNWGGGEGNRGLNRKRGYLGLSFQIDGETYYGWAKISVNMKTGVVTLGGYAYETVANMPINAGRTE